MLLINHKIDNTDNANLATTSLEINPMNTRSAFARFTRIACSLIALSGLLAVSRQSARADVVVDQFVAGSQTVGLPAGTTAMQLKVRNTDTFNVSGVTIQTYVYYVADTIAGWTVRAMPKSSAFALAAKESKWITIAIPATSLQGQSLVNRNLTAKAIVSNRTYWLNNFLNAPAQAKVVPNVTLQSTTSTGAKVFKITFTNSGNAPSTAQAVKVVTWKNAEGQVGAALTQTGSIPALAVGQSAILTFTSQPTEGYQLKGTIQIGTGNPFQFSL